MPNENESMYELQFPAPFVANPGAEGPTLVVALNGYADAGHAVDSSADHLLAALDHRLLASFNSDELIDYRSRRPAVTIDHNTIVSANDVQLEINVLRDSKGTSFLLLSGPEPDLRWDGFTRAVAEIVDKFKVSQTLCLYAAPMTVPHTRPLVVTAHGNAAHLIDSQFTLDSKITVPGSASLHLERLLNKHGHDVAGYTAHVPHYLSSSNYPQATLSLLQAVSDVTGLELPLRSLEADAQRSAQQIEEQIAASPEVEQLVRMLEQQYDEELERYQERHPNALMPHENEVNAETLGEEFERFLAELDAESGNPQYKDESSSDPSLGLPKASGETDDFDDSGDKPTNE